MATAKGIYRTNDWGQHWELVTNKIVGDHIIHANLIKAGNNYFALDKNKQLFISEDYGRNWTLIDSNILLYPIYSSNGKLFGLKDDQYLYVLNEKNKLDIYLNKSFGFISVVKPFCCNGIFISSDKNRVVFNRNNVIELPKIPILKEYDLLQEAYISKNYIIASVIDYGLWYIPYNLNIKF